MTQEVKQQIADLLTGGSKTLTVQEIKERYPSRKLVKGSEVTRLCPSPTGFVHIGTIFTAMICQYVARQTNGVYMLRIEDTDKKREVAGAKELIVSQLAAFGVSPDEGLQSDGSIKGLYGPYVQSERQDLYMAFAIKLLQEDRAYPCFATQEELQDAVKDQQAKKLRPGYYGEWALWRDRSDEEILAALNANKPFVLRFKSQGSHEKRITFEDVLKGSLEFPENDLDVPLIKSDEWRLPTYHLAHVVDDFLMGATIILRGEEWLPSTPLHLELADALSIPRFRYGHTPVISILDSNGGGKRKLSKRKDPEADVAFWLKQAYPLRAIKAYLLGLANSNFEDWYREHPKTDLSEFELSLEKLKTSRSPLLDMKKVEDYAKDEIARMPQEHFNKEILSWCEVHDHGLYESMIKDPEYTKQVLAIERDGEKPRKDVSKWSDAPEQFGYFFDDQYLALKIWEEGSGISIDEVQSATEAFLKTYSYTDDKDTWFEKMKQSAVDAGYCLDRKELKENPDAYKGGISDFAGIIRRQLTAKDRTPDLWTIMQIMGEKRVISRLQA